MNFRRDLFCSYSSRNSLKHFSVKFDSPVISQELHQVFIFIFLQNLCKSLLNIFFKFRFGMPKFYLYCPFYRFFFNFCQDFLRDCSKKYKSFTNTSWIQHFSSQRLLKLQSVWNISNKFMKSWRLVCHKFCHLYHISYICLLCECRQHNVKPFKICF